LRSDAWFYALEAFLKSLEADAGLNLAAKSISQISASATASRRAFLDSVQQAGMEVYREHLAKAAVWTQCESEWGQGPGFKVRVANHVNAWFASRTDLSTGLEGVVKRLWEETVVGPLLRLTKEETPAELATPANVVAFPAREPASHSQRA
jgi:hypothetical protein